MLYTCWYIEIQIEVWMRPEGEYPCLQLYAKYNNEGKLFNSKNAFTRFS